MIISPSAILNYLDGSRNLLPAFYRGELWRFLEHPDVAALARAAAVSGIRSPSRLRYLVLEVTPDQALEIIDCARGSRLKSQASQTTQIERRTAGNVPILLWQHNMKRCLAWRTTA